MGWQGGEMASDECREAAWKKGGRGGRGDEKPEGNSRDLENRDKKNSDEVKKRTGKRRKKINCFLQRIFKENACLLTVTFCNVF